MDISTALWIAWVCAFAALELIGLRSPTDRAWTLTNRIRALMRTSPLVRALVRIGLGLGIAWLAHHFLVVDPVRHPGA